MFEHLLGSHPRRAIRLELAIPVDWRVEDLVSIIDANDDVVAELTSKFASEGITVTLGLQDGDLEVAGEFSEVLEPFEPRLLLDLTAVLAVPAVATEFADDGL